MSAAAIGKAGEAERVEAIVRRIGRLHREIDALLGVPAPALAAPRPSEPPRPRRSRAPADPRCGAEIGARIREARRARAMTQLDLAQATGIRRPNVARLERGGNTPTLETLQRVAAALDLPLSELVGDR